MSNSNSFMPTAPDLETMTHDSSSEPWSSSNTTSDSTMLSSSSVSPSASSPSSSSAEVSTTTYSYTGSALVNESISNLNDKKNGASTPVAAAAAAAAGNGAAAGDKATDDKPDDSMFECNICLDIAKDAVVSMCGHLFCWPCLHQWLETRPQRKLCPVCKASIGKDKVIPLYGRNSTKQEDPRNKVPPRPAGQRIEPETSHGFAGFNFGDGFHMSFGIGAFPFGYFASSFNFGEPRPPPTNRGTAQYEEEQQLSKLFLYLAFLCIAWLLFA